MKKALNIELVLVKFPALSSPHFDQWKARGRSADAVRRGLRNERMQREVLPETPNMDVHNLPNDIARLRCKIVNIMTIPYRDARSDDTYHYVQYMFAYTQRSIAPHKQTVLDGIGTQLFRTICEVYFWQASVTLSQYSSDGTIIPGKYVFEIEFTCPILKPELEVTAKRGGELRIHNRIGIITP